MQYISSTKFFSGILAFQSAGFGMNQADSPVIAKTNRRRRHPRDKQLVKWRIFIDEAKQIMIHPQFTASLTAISRSIHTLLVSQTEYDFNSNNNAFESPAFV